MKTLSKSYLSKPLSFMQRKTLAKCRLGCIPIRLETGRYVKPRLLENERTCELCMRDNIFEIENETHVIFHCSSYKGIRKNDFDKLDYVLNEGDNFKATAHYLINIWI